jgi:putative FmdB family regulatory protein
MPMYEYDCNKCKKRYEVIVPLSKSDKKIRCPRCKRKLEKQLAAPLFVIK